MNFLTVIPARAGSKRLPGKNLMTIGGKSLVRLAVEVAFDVMDGEVVVSSDSDKILDEADLANPTVTLHQRSAAMSCDDASVVELLAHLLEARPGAEYVVLLNPTSPLRSTDTVSRAAKAIDCLGYTSAQSVAPSVARHYSWESGRRHPFLERGWPRSQDLEPCGMVHGAVIISSRAAVLAGRLTTPRCMAITTPPHEAIDIDTMDDLVMARALARYVHTGESHDWEMYDDDLL